MIHKSDLRVGNLVNYHDDNKIFKVLEIDTFGLKVENDEEETWIEYDCFSPIPLSSEILEKCGFVEMKTEMSGCRVWEIPNRLWRVAMSYRDELEFILWHRQVSPPTWRLASFKYLHELQNLIYALTKQELEYKP